MTFQPGDKVRLGNGSEGTVREKVERAGFSGYRVEVTKSDDPEQEGKTVAASPAGMSRIASVVSRVPVRIGGTTLTCEVAASPSEKSVGLQRHAGLRDDEGMYFPFNPPSRVQFHMGSVSFPIDIVFCMHGRVARVVPNAQPGTKARWGARCDGVLEVRGGWCVDNGVMSGAPVQVGSPRRATQTYDLLRTITEAQAEKPEPKKPKPTALDALKTFEKLERSRQMPTMKELAAEIYALHLEHNPEAVERDNMSSVELDRIVQSWEGKRRWLEELMKLVEADLLPGYDEDPKVYQQQFVWWLADELKEAVHTAHDFFRTHRDEFEELSPHMTDLFRGASITDSMYRVMTVHRARRLELLREKYAQAAQQLQLYFVPLGPDYLPCNGPVEKRFYDLLDLYDARAPQTSIADRWTVVSKSMDFLDRDAVVRALVDSGYPDAVQLLKVAQRHSEPDVREDVRQPGAVRDTPPEESWTDREIPADTPGVGDSADPAHWDQEMGYDVSVSDLLEDRVPPIRPSASRKTAGGDIHPGDRVRATENVDGLKDDQKGVCFEVQGDMVWIKFDGEPVPRWLKNDMLTQETEKEQVLQELEEGDESGGGGLAGLLGAMG